MNAIEHRTVTVNGLPTHLAEAGSGPLVVLLHGFPELWYSSWRHQLLPQPILFAGGALDTAVRFSDLSVMRALIPNLLEPLVMPGCGHWIQQERPDEINAAILAFLDKVG
ncbi:hypothetical protein [Nocardia sp. NPDC059239]|uniref:alpha/beta fold hydrolase n=1 Tax=unclassified Nocardia TaxID=2637762 RepID=UPI0036AB8FCA